MHEQDRPQPSARRTKAGDKYPGVCERTSRHGGRVLEVGYYDRGRRRWKTLPPETTLKDAVKEGAKLSTDAAAGNAPPLARAPKLADVWETWLESAKPSLRPWTVEHYRHAGAFKGHGYCTAARSFRLRLAL